MPPSLRVSAGPSTDKLTVLPVNDETKPFAINSDSFEGQVIVRIKGFTGELPKGSARLGDTHYFDHSYAKGCTWSIAIQGRFKEEVEVDAVEYGNLFEKPIRDRLPWGTSAALTAISYIDPNLHQDIYADKPWAFSPLICTMSKMHVERLTADVVRHGEMKDWPVSFPHGQDEKDYTQEDTSVLLCKQGSTEVDPSLEEDGYADMSTLSSLRSSTDQNATRNRVKFWGNRGVRQATKFTPQDVITMDFCHGYLQFDTLTLRLAGMTFDLTAYHDGQPVRFVARNRYTEKIYFVVEFQIAAKDA